MPADFCHILPRRSIFKLSFLAILKPFQLRVFTQPRRLIGRQALQQAIVLFYYWQFEPLLFRLSRVRIGFLLHMFLYFRHSESYENAAFIFYFRRCFIFYSASCGFIVRRYRIAGCYLPHNALFRQVKALATFVVLRYRTFYIFVGIGYAFQGKYARFDIFAYLHITIMSFLFPSSLSLFTTVLSFAQVLFGSSFQRYCHRHQLNRLDYHIRLKGRARSQPRTILISSSILFPISYHDIENYKFCMFSL